MIIAKAPFRVSFCGGGSDLSSYYRRHGGCVISTSINKYMYISVHPYFNEDITVIKYSKTESVKDIKTIEHPIFKTVLNSYKVKGVEITSTADIPSGTGLGSSSTFTVALLQAINSYKGKYVSKEFLASMASKIEIDILKSPIGKQDQYAAAYGGLNLIRFYPDDTVSVQPVIMQSAIAKTLQENLLLFYTGTVRSANTILGEQNKNMSDKNKIQNLSKMCLLAEEMYESLQNNKLSKFGSILHESWLLKKTLASGISTGEIDKFYNIAMENGALGGKLLGAGGGGFLLFYCDKKYQNQLRKNIGLKEMPFSFENSGAGIIFVGDKYWS